jgi:hypothetical protein
MKVLPTCGRGDVTMNTRVCRFARGAGPRVGAALSVA